MGVLESMGLEGRGSVQFSLSQSSDPHGICVLKLCHFNLPLGFLPSLLRHRYTITITSCSSRIIDMININIGGGGELEVQVGVELEQHMLLFNISRH